MGDYLLQQSKSVPNSFSQFYKSAHSVISDLFNSNQRLQSNKRISDLTPGQINHYNLIQLKTFQLTKIIKSKFNGFTRQEVSGLLIQIQDMLEELEKFCTSLNLGHFYQLFQKISYCMIMIASIKSMYRASGEKDDIPLEFSKSRSKIQNSKKLINLNSKSKRQSVKSKPNRKFAGEIKKLKLGGINLYNQSYIRHLQNRLPLFDLNDMMNDHKERKQFWTDLKRNFKQTFCLVQQCNTIKIKEEVNSSQQNENLPKLKQNLLSKRQNKLQKQGVSQAQNQLYSDNAHNMLLHTEMLLHDLKSSAFTTQNIEKTINQISFLYQNQKHLTINLIKKILKKIAFIYGQKFRALEEQMKQMQKLNQKLLYQINSKNSLAKTVAMQTISYFEQQTVAKNQKILNCKIQQLNCIQANLQLVVRKQNMNIMMLQKNIIQQNRKLQTQTQRCIELRNQVNQLKQQIQKIRTKQYKSKSKIQLIENQQLLHGHEQKQIQSIATPKQEKNQQNNYNVKVYRFRSPLLKKSYTYYKSNNINQDQSQSQIKQKSNRSQKQFSQPLKNNNITMKSLQNILYYKKQKTDNIKENQTSQFYLDGFKSSNNNITLKQIQPKNQDEIPNSCYQKKNRLSISRNKQMHLTIYPKHHAKVRFQNESISNSKKISFQQNSNDSGLQTGADHIKKANFSKKVTIKKQKQQNENNQLELVGKVYEDKSMPGNKLNGHGSLGILKQRWVQNKTNSKEKSRGKSNENNKSSSMHWKNRLQNKLKKYSQQRFSNKPNFSQIILEQQSVGSQQNIKIDKKSTSNPVSPDKTIIQSNNYYELQINNKKYKINNNILSIFKQSITEKSIAQTLRQRSKKYNNRDQLNPKKFIVSLHNSINIQ